MKKTACGRRAHGSTAYITKTLLVMKLTTFLITLAFLNVSAAGLSQKVSFSGKNVPLVRVFTEVEKQTGFVFIYAKNTLEGTHPVTLQMKDVPVEAFMQKLLADQPVKFTIDYQTILLSRKPTPAQLARPQPIFSLDSMPKIAEDTLITVKGWITNEKLEAIDGASVMIRETGRGTTANFQGQFEIKNVRNNAVLVISAVGFETMTVHATDKNFIRVRLKVAESKLDEAQVIAYGKTTTRYSTGNITRISGEELRKQPVMNPMMALQGKVAGLTVAPTAGHSAAPVKLEVRGRNSLNMEFSGEPLYIIDGVPRTILDAPSAVHYNEGVSPGFVQGGHSVTGGQSPFFGMNAEDIESIEVLKDGDATAIYGSRGANGVVIITTRKPQPGKTTFSLQLNQERTDIAQYPEMLDRETYFQIRRQSMRNLGIIPTALNAPDLALWDTTKYVDWQRELLQTGTNTKMLATLSGGDTRNSFRLSASYNTIRSMDKIPNKNGALNVNFGFNHSSNNRKFTMDMNLGQVYTFTEAVSMGFINPAPNAPAILDDKGNPNYAEYQGLGPIAQYPWASLFQPGKTKVHSMTSSMNAGYVIMDGLTVRLNMGFNNASSTNNLFKPLASLDPFQPGLTGIASFGESKTMNWSIDPTINYSKYFGKGKLNMLVGTGIQRATTYATSIYATGYTMDALIESPANATTAEATDALGIYKYYAIFGRINYQWDGKYILNLNARRDGSSRFGPGKQFGNFGSVGVAWIASEEKWWKKVMPSLFSFFKLRGSYGVSGNDAVGDYQYLSQWSGQVGQLATSRLYDYNGTRPYVPLHAINQLFQWETVRKMELAADLELANRYTLSLAWYRQVCDDQLTNQPVPAYSGFPMVLTNSPAKVENTGFEGTLNARIIERKNFNWITSFNIAFNRNKLLAYPNLEKSRHASRYKVGASLNTNYLYHYLGVNPLTGEYMVEDYNKDGIISKGNNIPGSPGNDAYVEKDLSPFFNGGFSTLVAVKGISVSLQFAYSKTLSRDPLFQGLNPGGMGVVYIPAEILENSWKKPGDIAKYAALSSATTSINSSDGGIIDGSFIQLNNIAIAWKVPERILKPARLSNATVSLNANNIYTLTRHTGVLSQGLNNFSQPVPRTIAMVLSFTF